MYKVYFSRMFRIAALALLLGALAACGGKDEIKQGTSDAAAAPAQYDLTVRADKDGQFDLEGATLTAEDLRSHIRYRNEPGNQPVLAVLPETVVAEVVSSAPEHAPVLRYCDPPLVLFATVGAGPWICSVAPAAGTL